MRLQARKIFGTPDLVQEKKFFLKIYPPLTISVGLEPAWNGRNQI